MIRLQRIQLRFRRKALGLFYKVGRVGGNEWLTVVRRRYPWRLLVDIRKNRPPGCREAHGHHKADSPLLQVTILCAAHWVAKHGLKPGCLTVDMLLFSFPGVGEKVDWFFSISSTNCKYEKKPCRGMEEVVTVKCFKFRCEDKRQMQFWESSD